MKNFFKNPLVNILVGLLIAATFFWLSSGQSSPSFSVKQPDAIASITNQSSNLKIYWDDRQLENAYATKVLIWNAGRKHLAFRDLKKNNILRLTHAENIEILNVQIGTKARANLKFNVLRKGESKDWKINYEDEESFEPKEGVELRVLFTSKNNPSSEDFVVAGGVIGHSEGWERLEWNSLQLKNGTYAFFLLVLITLLASGYSWAVFWQGNKTWRRDDGRYSKSILIPALLSMSIWVLVLYAVFLVVRPLYNGLSWFAF